MKKKQKTAKGTSKITFETTHVHRVMAWCDICKGYITFDNKVDTTLCRCCGKKK
jgi:hypothetical protein